MVLPNNAGLLRRLLNGSGRGGGGGGGSSSDIPGERSRRRRRRLLHSRLASRGRRAPRALADTHAPKEPEPRGSRCCPLTRPPAGSRQPRPSPVPPRPPSRWAQ